MQSGVHRPIAALLVVEVHAVDCLLSMVGLNSTVDNSQLTV